MANREAARAILAHQQVDALDKRLAEDAKEGEEAEKRAKRARRDYATIAHRLPLMVRRAGLSSALLFVCSRKNEHQLLLLDHLAAQLNDAGLCDGTIDGLLKAAREADLWALERLTAEAERCLLWTKRLTVTVLGVTANQTDRQDNA